MSLIRKHGAVLQAWACLALVYRYFAHADRYEIIIWESNEFDKIKCKIVENYRLRNLVYVIVFAVG